MATTDVAFAEERREARDEVHHRTRGLDESGRPVALLVVNLSPHGMMARCDADVAEGARLRVPFPDVGTVAMQVRWSLGGRIGCQFDRPLQRAPYYELLALLLR